MNKKYLILAILLTGLVVGFNVKAESPAVSISDFKASVSKPGTITGSFSLEDKSNPDLTDVTYYLTLQGKPVYKEIDSQTTEVVVQPIVAKYQNLTPFELKTNEKKDLTFSLNYPVSIKPGEYQLKLHISNSLGSKIYSVDLINLSLEGSDSMLTIILDSCKVINKEGVEYQTFEGALFDPGDQPTVKCEVSNPTSKAVEFTVNYQTAILHVLTYGNQKIQESKSQEIYSLKSNETKEITLTLPKETEPNIYETFAQFIEKGTNNVISPYLVFRWTIKGEAARIDKVEVEPFKSNYTKGEKITVMMDYAPSPDLYWRGMDENLGTDLKDAKIILTLYDKNNKICGQGEKNIGEIFDVVRKDEIELSLNSSCKANQLLSQISKGNKVLVSYTLNFPTEVPTGIKEIVYFAFAVLLIVAGLVTWFILKRKINLILKIVIIVLLLILIIYLGLILFTVPVKADSGSLPEQNVLVKYGPGLCRFSILYMLVPRYNISDYQEGGLPSTATVLINGHLNTALCDNSSARLFFTFIFEGVGGVPFQKIYSFQAHQPASVEEEFDFRNDPGFNNVFRNLEAGNYNLIVEGRIIFYHGWRNQRCYQPAAQEGSYMQYFSPAPEGVSGTCCYSNEGDSFVKGWGGPNYSPFTSCGDGQILRPHPTCGNTDGIQYTYLPLTFNLPFVVYPPETLSASLMADPNSGRAPLNDVDLKADVLPESTARGSTANYTFWCNCNYSSTNINETKNRCGNWDHKQNNADPNSYTAVDVCDYATGGGSYTPKVIIEKGSAVAEAFTTVTVGTNTPPTANAGPDKTINEGQSTTLEGSGSDPDSDPITYNWSCTGGSLSNPNISQPTYTGPLVSGDTNYTCTLTVSDNQSASDTDSMIVTVKDVVAAKPTAGFMCTLTKPAQQTQESWKICNKDNIKPFKGQWVYLKDDPTLITEYSYTAAEGITITNRKWEIVGGEVFSPNPNPPDNNNPNDNNPNNLSPVVKTPVVGEFRIKLTVTDSNGRTDDVEHTLNGRLPPPDWIEIPPF